MNTSRFKYQTLVGGRARIHMPYDVALYDFVELNPTKPFCYRCEAQVQKETELRQTVCINSYPNDIFDSYLHHFNLLPELLE